MDVTDAVRQRHSVRAFRPDPVPAELVREILDLARHAPSGGNLQPWQVYVVTGEPLARFRADIAAKHAAGLLGSEPIDYDIYPPNLWEPLRTRRRDAGVQRYRAIGGERGPAQQFELERQNFDFFGAPVGLFYCLDRRCGPPQWSDVGMYMQTFMLLAVERGLATCPQEVWSRWPKSVAKLLALPANLMLFSGMSLGYADEGSAMNGYRTGREGVEAFATFIAT